MKNFFIFLLSVSLLSCNSDDNSSIVSDGPNPALRLYVKNSQTNQFITEDIMVTVTDDGFTETLNIFPDSTFQGPLGRPGNYTINIDSEMYMDIDLSDFIIEVVTDENGQVITKQVMTILTPN